MGLGAGAQKATTVAIRSPPEQPRHDSRFIPSMLPDLGSWRVLSDHLNEGPERRSSEWARCQSGDCHRRPIVRTGAQRQMGGSAGEQAGAHERRLANTGGACAEEAIEAGAGTLRGCSFATLALMVVMQSLRRNPTHHVFERAFLEVDHDEPDWGERDKHRGHDQSPHYRDRSPQEGHDQTRHATEGGV